MTSPRRAADASARGDDLEARLADERRTCPQCGYAILNPLTDRCPRCFALVARVETNCGSCAHQGGCEFARLHESMQRKQQASHSQENMS